MILGRDSITAADIPLDNLSVVMGYAGGNWTWTEADWNRFSCPKLSIAVHPDEQADILDVESGDAVPSDIPGWVGRFDRPQRRRPTIYCNLSNWPACIQAAGARKVDWWVADYYTDDPAKVKPLVNAVAIQYHDFGGYDESVIFDPTWIGGSDVWDIDQKRLAIIEVRRHYEAWPANLPSVDVFAGQIKDDGTNYLEVRQACSDQFRHDGWTDLFDRVARLEGIVSKLSPSDPAVAAEIQTLQQEMAAIAKAAAGG